MSESITCYKKHQNCRHYVLTKVNPEGRILFQHNCTKCAAKNEPPQVYNSKDVPIKEMASVID